MSICDRVKLHYDSKHSSVRCLDEGRGFRNFNNYVKACLVNEAVHKHDRVLDICCGSGGDLSKLKHAQIHSYVGIDLSETCISNATERAALVGFSTHFYLGDASEWLPDGKFDAVMCNFGPQFFFRDGTTLRRVMQSVSERLESGGRFFGCVPCCEKICDGAQKRDAPYRIRFSSPPTLTEMGQQYTFTLPGCVDDCPEYLAPREAFERSLSDHGFDSFTWTPFLEYWGRDPRLMQRMRASALTESDRLVAELYVTFVAEKR